MATFLTLARRELGGYFLSLRGYVIIAGVQFLLGASLLIVLDALNDKPFDMPLTEKIPNSGFFWLILLLMAPVITMRTFAHEKSTGTFEALLTTPVSDRAVVLAKFCGPVVFAQLLGVNYLIAGIFQAISPGLAGWTHDLTDSYQIAFMSVACLSVLGALFTLWLRVPESPVEVEATPG